MCAPSRDGVDCFRYDLYLLLFFFGFLRVVLLGVGLWIFTRIVSGVIASGMVG